MVSFWRRSIEMTKRNKNKIKKKKRRRTKRRGKSKKKKNQKKKEGNKTPFPSLKWHHNRQKKK